jgi:hypothetical protein
MRFGFGTSRITVRMLDRVFVLDSNKWNDKRESNYFKQVCIKTNDMNFIRKSVICYQNRVSAEELYLMGYNAV